MSGSQALPGNPRRRLLPPGDLRGGRASNQAFPGRAREREKSYKDIAPLELPDLKFRGIRFLKPRRGDIFVANGGSLAEQIDYFRRVSWEALPGNEGEPNPAELFATPVNKPFFQQQKQHVQEIP